MKMETTKRYSDNELEKLGVWGKQIIPPYWGDLRRYVFKRDGYKCYYCHKTFRNGKLLDAHHLIWRNNGGSDNPKNLVTVCTPCHDEIHGIEKPDDSIFKRDHIQDDVACANLVEVKVHGLNYKLPESRKNFVPLKIAIGIVRFIIPSRLKKLERIVARKKVKHAPYEEIKLTNSNLLFKGACIIKRKTNISLCGKAFPKGKSGYKRQLIGTCPKCMAKIKRMESDAGSIMINRIVKKM